MSETYEWATGQQKTDGEHAFKVLTVSFSHPSESLADMIHHMGFQSLGIKDDVDLLRAFRRLKPDLLLLSPSIPSEQIGPLTGLVWDEKEGFPILCISDRKEKPRREAFSDGVNLAFLPNTFEPRDLKNAIEKMVQNSLTPEQYRARELDELIIGKTPAIVDLKRRILQVSQSDLTVLITGESGTGKEVVARALHRYSSRARKPFIKVNSAGFPAELFESELFGYKKGAFTGAYQSKPGKFELADSGTIFLDEVGEIPLLSQAKLLHVLEGSEFSPLGSTKNTRVDTRVIAATNAVLNSMVKTGKFRLDLYYRLGVVCLHMPPLRQRKDDIDLLCHHFFKKYAGDRDRRPLSMPDDMRERFSRYHWPGNVRQLENAIRSLVALGNADGVLPGAARRMKHYTLKKVCKEAVEQAEKKVIEDVLNQTGWNRKEAATVLETSYRNLLNKIREYDIIQGSGFLYPSRS